MLDLKQEIKNIKSELSFALKNASSSQDIEKIRVEFLGKKGKVTLVVAQVKNLSIEDKRIFGPLFNELKTTSEELIESKYQELLTKELTAKDLKKQNFDVTAYKTNTPHGSLHIY